MKKEEVKKGNTRLIGLGVIIGIIVIVTIIIIVTNVNKNKEIVENEKEEVKTAANTINPDAKPEDSPTIAGEENIDVINGVKVNNSKKITSDRTYKTYEFTNIKLEATNRGTILTAKVSTSSKEKTKGEKITIKFYDNTGKFVSQLTTYIGQIKPGEKIDFRAESTSDLSNAYDMTIE